MMKNYPHLIMFTVLLLSSTVAAVAQGGSRLPGGSSLRGTSGSKSAMSSTLRGGGNDACANAVALAVNASGTCAANAISGDNGFATQDGGVPDCDATTTLFQDVWYTFNSGPNTALMIEFTLGTIQDLVVEVYSGGCFGTSVYCDFGELMNMVTVNTNTNYTVRVSSNNDFGVGGTFTICVSSMGGAPANDLCNNATPITVGATCVGTAGSVAGATQALAPSTCGGFTAASANDVWYSFTATAASTTVEVTGAGDADTGMDPILEIYSGTCGALASLGCADATLLGATETLTVPTTVGVTYYYRIYKWPYGTPVTADGFTTCVFSAGGPGGPVNDLCANATPITVGASCVGTAGTIENATQSVAPAACSGFTATVANDVWYTFTATAASTTVQVTGAGDATTGVDPILEVFSGNCAALVSLGCVDATVRGGTETLVVATTVGATYVYRIYHWPYAAPQTVFGFTTCVFSAAGPGGPVNDLCANATPITVGATCVGTAGTIENATQSVAPAACSGFTATVANDVWYTFTATAASTTVEVTGAGDATTGMDPILEVFSGNCAALVSLGCVDATLLGATETLTVPTTVGVTYYYRIYKWPYVTPVTADAFTTCVFNAGPVGTPPNDLCGSATPQSLPVGGSITFTGDNTNATSTGDALAGSIMDVGGDTTTVWHAFTITECATITLAYCGTTTLPAVYWAVLSENCPANDDVILFSAGNFTDCADGNATITFANVPAGTYYVPVRGEPATAGPYTIDVSAVACVTAGPYCDAGATNLTFEKISNVTFAGINNNSTGTAGYEDFTSIPASVVGGLDYPISVTVSGGFATDQVLAWVDWDQNEVFDVDELVFASPNGVGPFTGTVTVPLTALTGVTRMRVRLHDTYVGPDYPNTPNDTPCGNSTYGQVEDYTVDVTGIITGVPATSAQTWSVFPNPGNGDLTIQYGGADAKVTLEVLDMTGRLVHGDVLGMTQGGQVMLPLAGRLASGTYMIRFTSDRSVHEQRFIVR